MKVDKFEQMNMFSIMYDQYKITKPIRLIELFAGIGSQHEALKRLGADVEPYKVVEFDKYAIASYNAIHGTCFETSDITKIAANDLEIVDTDKYEYIMTYSFPCFTKDSLVLTNKGYKKIINIKVNDYVLTHDNTFQKVTKFFDNGIHDIYVVKGQSIDEIKCTYNHKFYVRTKYHEWVNDKRTYVRKFKQPEWKELNKLTKNDYLGIAINKNSIIPTCNNKLSKYMNNKDFWWVIGRYIGDGWIRQQGGIIICCSRDELNEITEKLMFKYNVVEEKNVYKIHIPLKELGCFVEQFGRGAKNKRLTNTILDLPIELLEQFIIGYESADGCIINNLHKICSISRELIYGVGQCIAKVYKTPFRIYKNNRPNFTIIENRVVRQNDDYQIVYKKDKCKQDKAFYENGYVWFPISKIEKLNKENVYDIEVENNHSFTVQNTIVHNCQDLSLAGKGKGMQKGSGTRSGLLWEVERILEECNELPQVLLMENVPQVHSEENMPDFIAWQNKLESLGYTNYWQDLNAKDYGIPQNRNRCFMISILGKHYYEFPKPFKLELKLKDMLESEVDEKYYLSDKQVQGMKKTKFNCYSYYNRLIDINGISPCIIAGYDRAPIFYLRNNKECKFTSKECWRLMGFTDDSFDKAEKVNSNAQLYKQAGNSIVVTVLMNIFKQLLEEGLI